MKEFLKRILSSLALIPLVVFVIIKGSFYFYILLFIVLIISFYEWTKMSKNKSYNLFGYFFFIFSILCVYQLRFYLENNYWPLLIITTICVLTDVGGFVFGKIFKGPKLTKYSPNKTYSGLLGSFFLSLSVIPFLLFYDLINENQKLDLIIFVILISAASQIGDIVVSYFKRISNIKDTGKIIPGHGGLLDRIDGMLFAFPVAYFLILIIFPKILS